MRPCRFQRHRFALAALTLVAAASFAIHVHRCGNIFFHATRYGRCRECGLLLKESVLAVFGAQLYDTIEPSSTALSRILLPPHAPCPHSSELLVFKREVDCSTETFPSWRALERRSGGVAGLADNRAFQQTLAALSRTNLPQARAVWSCLCRLDYRSSNLLAGYATRLGSTNAAAVLDLLRSEAAFGFSEKSD